MLYVFSEDNGDKRCEALGRYIVLSKSTVRDAAMHYGISKSTVHKDITDKLAKVNPPLFAAVREVLEINKSERHIRGGEATKKMYKEREELQKIPLKIKSYKVNI